MCPTTIPSSGGQTAPSNNYTQMNKQNQALPALLIFIFLILFLFFLLKKPTIITNEPFTGRLLPGRTLISIFFCE